MTTPPPITAERMRELAADAENFIDPTESIDFVAEVMRALSESADALDRLIEAERKLRGYQQECSEVEQILSKALGYPWFKDDQKNFPGATEADGVCIGEHAPATLAAEAARCLAEADALADKFADKIFSGAISTDANATHLAQALARHRGRQSKAQPPQTERKP